MPRVLNNHMHFLGDALYQGMPQAWAKLAGVSAVQKKENRQDIIYTAGIEREKTKSWTAQQCGKHCFKVCGCILNTIGTGSSFKRT